MNRGAFTQAYRLYSSSPENVDDRRGVMIVKDRRGEVSLRLSSAKQAADVARLLEQARLEGYHAAMDEVSRKILDFKAEAWQ